MFTKKLLTQKKYLFREYVILDAAVQSKSLNYIKQLIERNWLKRMINSLIWFLSSLLIHFHIFSFFFFFLPSFIAFRTHHLMAVQC